MGGIRMYAAVCVEMTEYVPFLVILSIGKASAMYMVQHSPMDSG